MGSGGAAWTRSLHDPVACLLLSQRLSDPFSPSPSLSILPLLALYSSCVFLFSSSSLILFPSAHDKA